jgi:hypothetical protein
MPAAATVPRGGLLSLIPRVRAAVDAAAAANLTPAATAAATTTTTAAVAVSAADEAEQKVENI